MNTAGENDPPATGILRGPEDVVGSAEVVFEQRIIKIGHWRGVGSEVDHGIDSFTRRPYLIVVRNIEHERRMPGGRSISCSEAERPANRNW